MVAVSPFVHTANLAAEQVVDGRQVARALVDGQESKVTVDDRPASLTVRAVIGCPDRIEAHVVHDDDSGIEVDLAELLRTVVRVGDNVYGRGETTVDWAAIKRAVFADAAPTDEWGYVIMPRYVLSVGEPEDSSNEEDGGAETGGNR